MRIALRRPGTRVSATLAAVAVAAGVVVGVASPAHADYTSPLYKTLAACKAARPTYVSSWTSPGPCYPMYNWNGTKRVGYAFKVTTRG
ncbi:hypothetical protein GCM10027280_15380 [Micromonospora polyrhachis]|uniref:Uncharacterized protein n=1 Tax=Micromonospora polyrhachis TaxID=1282883 RepID=A0A7W7SPI2_9ACTN|nr:hypothetical protein [Micromonospora polyrhachis]MBB4958574.1 hypothetical protein [Micromonospora polyrhachis]